MNAFTLKMIALAAMIIDHAGAVFPQYFGTEFRVVGRIAWPIFAYLVAEGFRHTRSPGRFLMRLGIFAIISEPFYDWTIGRGQFPYDVNFFSNTNIFYTLFFGGLAIVVYEWGRRGILSWRETGDTSLTGQTADEFTQKITLLIVAAPAIAIFFAVRSLGVDYGIFGVLFILLMYAIKPPWFRLGAMAVMSLSQFTWIWQEIFEGYIAYIPTLNLMMLPAALVPVVLVGFYNGKRGLGFKWLFYAAYPAHLAVLMVLAIVLKSPYLT